MADYRAVDVEQLESDLTVVANAIREKGGTSEPLAFPNGMKEAIEGIQSGGVDWLKYADAISFNSNDYNKDKLPEIVDVYLPNSVSISNFFRNHLVTPKIIRVELNQEVTYQASNWFNCCRGLEVLEFKGGVKLSVISSMFNQCFALKEIKGVIDLSASWQTSNAFVSCNSLEEIRFRENSIPVSIQFNYSPLLSATSRQSIIDGLADLTGQTAQTITFHKDIEAKLSDEQKAQITSKNWTLAFSK